MRVIDKTGDTTTLMGVDELTGDITIKTVQDVKPFLERMKQMRLNADYSKKGIKEEWWHYASVPNVVIMELRNKGIDFFNPDDMKKALKEINANYSWLKATDKIHA